MGDLANPPSRAELMAQEFHGNTWLIEQKIESVTMEESLWQPGYGANCMNWVLGHILWRRNVVLETLERPPVWTSKWMGRYQSGSAPVLSADDARPFDELAGDLEVTQALIAGALRAFKDERLDERVKTDRGERTRLEFIQGLHWHETFHMGHLDMLRTMIDFSRA